MTSASATPENAPIPSSTTAGVPLHVNAHRRVLQLIAERRDLSEILESLTAHVEREIPTCRASVVLLQPDGVHVNVGAAPSLPFAFSAAIDGAAIGSDRGSCGVALAERRVVISPDLTTDPAWQQWWEAAQSAGLAACWSTPFVGADDRLLGTFAVYFAVSRTPEASELDVLHDAGWLAAIAVQADGTNRALTNLSRTDQLTGLHDRHALESGIDENDRRHTTTVLAFGIDGAAAVNECFGYEAGDLYLRMVADRLSAAAAPHLVARIAGDEFAVLATNLGDEDGALRFAESLREQVARPGPVGNRTLHPSMSIGASWHLRDAVNGAEAVRQAGAALARARAGDGAVVMFHSDWKQSEEDLNLAADLREGLSLSELGMVFQPIVDLAGGQPVRYEALMRWTHSMRGPVDPRVFIPAAERTGLIGALGRFALIESLDAFSSLQTIGAPAGISVNISAQELRDPGLATAVEDLLNRRNIAAQSLTLEVTEHSMLRGGAARDVLSALRDRGIRIAIDDFGIGYSQLSYLRDFQFDELKIDRSFIADLARNSQAKAIVKNLLALAENLGVDVVAEGIETQEQRDLLAAMGCQFGQGFLFGYPQAADLGLTLD